MQLAAPVPIPIISDGVPPDLPLFLGRDYHGAISHIQAQNLLNEHQNGAYLVRSSRSSNGEFHTLSLKSVFPFPQLSTSYITFLLGLTIKYIIINCFMTLIMGFM